jgi:hypothetical protein
MSGDVDDAATDRQTVLPAIARRASGAVQAERFLVVVQVEDEPARPPPRCSAPLCSIRCSGRPPEAS